jgi:hypothetical protein
MAVEVELDLDLLKSEIKKTSTVQGRGDRRMTRVGP